MRASLLAALLPLAACGGGSEAIDGGFFLRDTGSGTPTDAGMIAHDQILVSSVADGDTIRVSAGQSVRTPDGREMNGTSIRLLGINAPEIAHTPAPAECWGDQASMAAKGLLQGKIITLEYDPGHEIRDQFGRLLAYVVLPDNRVVNEVLVQTGEACSFRAFTHRDTAKYNALEKEAKDAKLGMWTCPAAEQSKWNCR